MTQGEDYNMTRICLVHEIEIIMRFLQIKSYHNQKKHQMASRGYPILLKRSLHCKEVIYLFLMRNSYIDH